MLVALALVLVSPTAARATSFADVYDAALSGDMAKALSLLDSLDASSWTARDSTAASCMRRTFAVPPQDEDLPPLSRRVLSAYRDYWQAAMLRRASVKDAEAQLLAALNAILGPGATDSASGSGDLDAASERAKAAIGREGLFALTGVTSPYYELMLWKTQTPVSYRVKLPERAIDVHVVFLDDFVSLGWAGYATCGRAHSGGWAMKDSLYAVKSAYDVRSEAFRVSYLAHEGRHFSDYREFPKLEQPELEYRAKLTEIAVSDTTTYDLAVGFARRTGTDRSVPHAFADYCVARDLSDALFKSGAIVTDEGRWRAIAAPRIRAAATRLLEQNAGLLKRKGAATTERFLVVATPPIPAIADTSADPGLRAFREWLDREHSGYGCDEGPAPFRNRTVEAAYPGARLYYVLTYTRGIRPPFPNSLSLVAALDDKGNVTPFRAGAPGSYGRGLRHIGSAKDARLAAAGVLIVATCDPGTRRWPISPERIETKQSSRGWKCTYRYDGVHSSWVQFDEKGGVAEIGGSAPPVP